MANLRPLVRYGKLGLLGCFSTDNPRCRGESVLLRTDRGLELGEVLLPDLPAELAPHSLSERPTSGELLRIACDSDFAAARAAEETAHRLLRQLDADSPPWLILDVEATLDRCCILHALPPDDANVPDPTPWLQQWESRSGFRLRLLDLSRLPAPTPAPMTSPCSRCNSPRLGADDGCSSCGSGCSSGSCGRRDIDPAELTAYFAQLRQRFEAYSRHPLL